MKAYKDFIIHIPEEHKSTFKTESGFELYQDKRWSNKKTANTVVKVVETPFNYNGDIQSGDLVFIDHTVLVRMEHIKTGREENVNLIDRKKRLYLLDPSMLIAYKPKGTDTWTGFNDNILCKRVDTSVKTEEKKLPSGIIIPQSVKTKPPKLEVHVTNTDCKTLGLNKGDSIISKKLMEVNVWLQDTPFVWLRNKDVLAVH